MTERKKHYLIPSPIRLMNHRINQRMCLLITEITCERIWFSFQIIAMRVLFFLVTYCTVVHGACRLHVDDALSKATEALMKQWKIYGNK